MVRREHNIQSLKSQLNEDVRMIMADFHDDWENITDHLLSLYDFALRQGLSHDEWNIIISKVNPEIFKMVYFDSPKMSA